MPDMKFEWNSAAQFERVSAAAYDALSRLAIDAGHWWDAFAPVGTDPRTSGELKREWFTDIVGGEDDITLYFGSLSSHAIYVELGTHVMEPRAPIRKTAEYIAWYVPHALYESMTDSSGMTR